MSFYLRNNQTDFYKWCKKYIPRARYIIRSFESGRVSHLYYSEEYEEYQEALKIMRQYHTLIYSLTEEQQAFFIDCMVGDKKYEYNKIPYKHYSSLIYKHWQEICFPNGKGQTKTIDAVQLGVVLKAARERAGLTRTQVSDLLNINIKTLNTYENGTRIVKLEVLYRMSQLYKTSIDEIISKSMLDF